MAPGHTGSPKWMVQLEIRQARNQPAGGEGGNDRQFEHPPGAAVGHQRQGVVFDALQVLADLPGVDLPRAGKRHPLLDPIEQLHAQIILQGGNLPAHRALRQRELFRGARETLVPGRRFESDEQVRSRNFSSHGHSKIEQFAEYTSFAIT
jgi:hypothetical protein